MIGVSLPKGDKAEVVAVELGAEALLFLFSFEDTRRFLYASVYYSPSCTFSAQPEKIGVSLSGMG
jgi:hypothetical protein